MAYADVVLADSPNVYYKLADTADSSGNGLTLTDAGTTAANSLLPIENSAASQARDNNGVGLSRADNALLNPTSAITIECWLKPGGGTDQIILNKTNDYNFYLLAGGTYRVELSGLSSTQAQTTSTVVTGVAVHFVATYNGSTIQTYLNGVANGTPVAATGSIANTASAFEIGVRSGFPDWSGVFDEVAIYPTALSAIRIQAHYSAALMSVVSASDYAQFPKRKRRRTVSV